MEERLQKFLARCGLASRRKCEELISAGHVSVDGDVVTTLGTKVDPEVQKILVDGIVIQEAPLMYFAVYKPRGVVCTHHDPAGRPRAVDLVPIRHQRLFPIGRLDEDSEGLLLLTNDGELTQKVTHPSHQVPKVYHVQVKGAPDSEALEKLRKGVWLAEGKSGPIKVEVLRKTREATTLLMTLREGKNRHLRRVLAKVELPVRRLRRVRVGPVRLGSLKRGGFRKLTQDEVRALKSGQNYLPKERGPHRSKSSRPRSKGGPRAAPAGRARRS